MICPYCKSPATLVGKITDRETGRVAIQKYQCGLSRQNSNNACRLGFLVLHLDGKLEKHSVRAGDLRPSLSP